MRRLPVVLLPLALTIVVSLSNDGTATTDDAIEVSGSTGIAVESDGFEVFENGASSDDRLVGTYKLQVEWT